MEEAISKRREKDIPWISKKQWRAIDRLSKIAPFNSPNPDNKNAGTLAAHIEANPRLWWDYINGRKMTDYTMETFTLKDDDGNSIYYTDEEYDEEKSKEKAKSPTAKPTAAR